jgi:hypothetical protein
MGHTITVRLQPDLAGWLEETARISGASKGRIVREQLEAARERSKKGPAFAHLIGCVEGPENLSGRKGYSRT